MAEVLLATMPLETALPLRVPASNRLAKLLFDQVPTDLPEVNL